MGRYDQPQGNQNKLTNPALMFVSYKPKRNVDQETGDVKPPRFMVATKKTYIELTEVEFMSGGHVYKVSGDYEKDQKTAGSSYFADFNTPIKMFIPGQKAFEINYRDLKATPIWDENKLRLSRYTWGVLRYLDRETGEMDNVPAIFELSSGFQEFDKDDIGQLRKLVAGGGELVRHEKSEWRTIGFEETEQDANSEKLFESCQRDFILFFRQWIPGYLSKYFDENGEVIRFQDQV